MVYRGLEPSVQAVVESFRPRPVTAPAGHKLDEQTTFIVDEEADLDFLIDAGVEAFWILSEDESHYELVQFPITEGVGGFLGGILRGVKGMFNWLRNDAFDWLSRRLPGGNARQIAKLYAQNPDKAREVVKNGLAKQFSGPALDEQMRMFDAKMSRQQAMRTNAIQMLNRVRQNPNDAQARQQLQVIGDAYGAIQRAQSDAQVNGQDPHAAGAAAAKSGLQQALHKGMHWLAGTPHLAPSSAAHGAAATHNSPSSATKSPQQSKPGQPSQPNQMPQQGQFKAGDVVHATDHNGNPISGKVVQNPLYNPPQNPEPFMVQLADGSHMGMNAAQWQGGQPANQPAKQPATGPAAATGSQPASGAAKPAAAGASAPAPTGSPTGNGTGNATGQAKPAAAAVGNPQATAQHGAASPQPAAPAQGSNAPQQNPQAAAGAAATTPQNTAAPVNPSQAKPAAQQSAQATAQPQVQPQVPKAPPAKKGQVTVNNRKSYMVTVVGSPQTAGGAGTTARFASKMTGAQLMRALGNAASDGVVQTREHGPITASKVMVTDPSTSTTMTIAIKKGRTAAPAEPQKPAAPQQPQQPPAKPQQGPQP